MADAAVDFLLENMKQLFIHHPHLMSDAKNEVEKLQIDLLLFQAFLKESNNKWRKDERIFELVRQICDVVYEAGDVIDAIVVQAAHRKSTNYFLRDSLTPEKLITIAKQVETVAGKVRDIYGGETTIDFATGSDLLPEESERPFKKPENVGFRDEIEKIIGYLSEETEELDVISIVGMPGLGKTTLAAKVFNDPEIKYQFPTRIWVYVSQEFTTRDVFLAILREVTTTISEDDVYRTSQEELAQVVAANLENEEFLIVMDDVWTAEDWNKLQIALPKSNNMGKVLITSRREEVAWCANRNRPPHKLRFLTPDESWLLLRLEVFGKPEFPPELEVIGKLIAEQCDGLPLAIVLIGGILVMTFSASGEMMTKKNAWMKVSESLSTYLKEDPFHRMEKIIELSYGYLPNHLRACFLYFGMFPEDFDIPVWSLIRMWIAEGFIQQNNNNNISLEETAENYLNHLIKRNLVRIDKTKPDGTIKTCRIHDMLREFCRAEAGYERENLLHEIRRTIEGDFYPPICNIQRYRRVSIHSDVLDFVSSEPYGPRVRSFVCFSNEEITLPSENVSAIPAAFKLLRVLDVKPIRFPRLPIILYQLVHLRYIVLSFKIAVLPALFSKFWKLQTLVVDTTSPTLEIKADIWEMIELRHLKTNASAILSKPGKSSKQGEKLQTVCTISPESCTKGLFYHRARNLKTLAIRGRLASLLDGENGSFDSVGKLGNLDKLKLLNDVLSVGPRDLLSGLPPASKFPPKLRILTLSDTLLDWSQMSILGLLENLEILKLKHKAFMGKLWKTSDGGFRRLQVMHIGLTDLTVWLARGDDFPSLKRLELRNCEGLVQIPIGLADIPSLQVLDLHRSTLATASAKRIRKEKWEQEKASVFNLTIFPPDEE